VELRAFAERVLLGASLQDKLFAPELLTDGDRRRGAVPAVPGRPATLPLRSAERPPFPGAAQLGEPAAAVTALHAFANHELLAIELMALALLRWPEADPAFRAELALTLQEEQQHLQLYVDRIAELGESFGSRALSAFFWDTLAPVDTPAGFCAAMGLTLEQANLDFAGHFAVAFDAAGDAASGRILRRVLADEIRHVARGLTWFDRFRGEGDRFDAYVAALPAPLTPRRARGPGFAVAPRQQAGLSDDFIQRVRAFGASRGRAADVHWLNPPAEAGEGARALAWMRDLEPTAVLRASPDDVVLVSRRPGPRWLEQVSAAGFAVPALRVIGDGPDGGPVRAVRPWAATAQAARVMAPWGPITIGQVPNKVADGELLRQVLSELGPAERLIERAALPVGATSLSAVEAAVGRFRDAGFPRVVLKRPVGTSGRGQLRLFEAQLEPGQRRWLERALVDGPLRIEPWLDRVMDLSFQLDAGGLVGVVRFETDGTGRFLGAALEPPNAGLSVALARAWTADGRDPRWVAAVGRRLAAVLSPARAVGVDGFFYRSADGLRLQPLVEVNPRVTFGRLALDLRRRVAPGCVGCWSLVGPAALRRSGASSLRELAAQLCQALPTVLRDGRLVSCALPTADPAQVELVLPLLLVAPTTRGLQEALALAGLARREGPTG